MEAKLQGEINSLSVILKVHIYEPTISAVAEISFKAGIKEVVELLNSHPFLHEGDYNSNDRMKPLSECSWWEAKKKEWGVEK